MELVKDVTLFDSLKLHGVDLVFGCVDLNQEIGVQGEPSSEQAKVQYVQLLHEQAAVHAADGYARATGKPGVVLLTTASGVTNGITGIATAFSDSVPLVVIAGAFLMDPLHAEAFQELSIQGITMPITKHSFSTNSMYGLSEVLPEALRIAADGRPGPVVIEFSANSSFSTSEGGERGNRTANHRIAVNNKRLEKSLMLAKEYIETAEMPVVFIGGGVISSGAAVVLNELVEQSRIPVVSSLMGIGAMDAKNPLFLGMLGMHGTFAANKAVHHCDLLICIGARFSDRVTGKISGFSPKSKKIHVDVDSAEINKIIPVDLPIVSDAKEFLSGLKDQLDFPRIRENSGPWTAEVIEWKRTVPRFDKSRSILSPQTVIQLLNSYSDKDTIVVTDVGQHQIWTAHHYAFTKPRTLLTSGGLGTMGYGLPAAIGAAASCPGKSVICVSGDGSFQMNLQELMTAVKYQFPIKIVILNNGYLGMVRQWQELFYNGRYSSVKMSSPNFARLAEAYGVAGYRAGSEKEARKVIAAAFRYNGPALIEFDVVEEENVYPIVPPNHSNHQIILSR
ncbi:biosynthetic-type acetolactate synthase large subunit [Neobacillus sp. MM2021_6]|uniref:biosynthetic-type acetolactate synthase large subunit n=1 Tax=Bacillaceae TaxID=186817 RepID=UPI001407EAC4|nr:MULTISPECIES: biosynthetic-type acetolactate synthase large subunit [Bacillaceae]MBO0958688.1 biosynthetic-type acetolactate synthase large subunit [Neobacillus sp. MM2021_6]NHC18217.1 biosynthetic-type acetolactate synthase large subunit [Bacillus sp. MM2020_4]